MLFLDWHVAVVAWLSSVRDLRRLCVMLFLDWHGAVVAWLSSVRDLRRLCVVDRTLDRVLEPH